MYEQEKVELRYHVADRLGVDGELVRLITLAPFIRPPTARVSQTRRKGLVEHLRTVANSEHESVENAQSSKDEDDPSGTGEQSGLEQRVCETCGGRCCRNGGNKAYLDADTFCGFLANHPEHNVTSAMDAYIGCVPKRAYKGCCIYHTANGCALPREMRSLTCTNFCCQAMRQVRDAQQSEHPALVISVIDYRLERVLVIHQGEAKEVRPRRWKEAAASSSA